MKPIKIFRRNSIMASSFALGVMYISSPSLRPAQSAKAPESPSAAKTGVTGSISELWVDRDPSQLDLINGAGGAKHIPPPKFLYVKEDFNGTNPKFEISDADGGKWKAKLGDEAQPEVAVSRLLWAAGYYTDEDYFVPELHVAGISKLKRAGNAASPEGIVRNVRLKRHAEGEKKSEQWSWFRNPFVGTKEFDGLKVMMALVNNWDLKEVNNTVYQGKNGESRYLVSDLGASFGRTGNTLTRSKNNWADYKGSKFVEKVTADKVDFVVNSRPFLLAAVDAPNYVTRTKMEGIVKNIPRANAKWIGQVLGRLTRQQIGDCFRAAGYSAEDVEGYSDVVQSRIAELNEL